MKQMIVNVGGLTVEEKQRVNEALAKITDVPKIKNVTPNMTWFYAPSNFGLYVGWDVFLRKETSTHTPQQVLEMAEQGHVHAESMMLYAEDAKTHPEPWKLWQVSYGEDKWHKIRRNPTWGTEAEYRRKPKTKLIHGVEVPDIGLDLSKCTERTDFYVPCVRSHKYYVGLAHHAHNNCIRYSQTGIAYPYTDEGKQAAILHAKAMLGIV